MSLINACPDCGAGLCQPHQGDCDIERCLHCSRQRITCDCLKKAKRAFWTGEVESSFTPDEGRIYRSKDIDASLAIQKNRKVRLAMKACWDNAFQVVTKVPEYRHVSYIEGIAVYPCGVFMEHGWLEVDGKVIDPTLPTDEFIYIAGLTIAGAEAVLEAVDRLPRPEGAETIPLFVRFGWGGERHPGIAATWRVARKMSEELIASEKEACHE